MKPEDSRESRLAAPGLPLDPRLVELGPVELGPADRVPPPSPPVVRRPAPRWLFASTLLFLTLVSTTTIGALWNEADGLSANTALWASPQAMQRLWNEPDLLARGLAYSLPLLFILLCHEMGHYLACRYYRLPATLPYFLPLPVGLGTLGAFIRIKAPIRRKRVLFDVGVAGPLAGFAALFPILVYGIANSQMKPMPVTDVGGEPVIALGINLVTLAVVHLFHGGLAPGMVLDLHPAALAAWVGLLATALNLIPVGQLDGGHVLYAATGRWQHRLALPLWLLLVAAGTLWFVWWVWCVFLLVMGLRHPPVRDEAEPLGAGRTALAALALAIFVLSFMPVPIGVVFVK